MTLRMIDYMSMGKTTAGKFIKKKPKHYVNNEEFLVALKEYQKKVKDAEAEGKEPPRIPEYIGECIFNIANKLSLRDNFINYPFREEMVYDGIENCIVYLNNFDGEKYDKPFAYFTQIIWYAFLRRIQKEKKQLYIKHKVMEREILAMNLADVQDDDFQIMVKIDNEFMTTFVDDFETKLSEKNAKNKKNKEEIESIEDETE